MLTEDYKEILDVSRKFAAKEIGQHILDIDLEPSIEWTKALWMKSREVGFPGLVIPESHGGFSQTGLCAALVLDSLASECAGAASIFAHHYAACKCIMAGNTTQQKTYLPQFANSNAEDAVISTVVFLPSFEDNKLHFHEKKGRLVLSGKSELTANAFLARYFCVFLDEGNQGKDITCIVIDKNDPGVKIGDSAGFTGLKINPFAPVIFDEVTIERERFIGERGKGFEIMRSTEDLYHGLLAASAMGAARTAYRKARAYAAERYQYGTMIINHQEIQRMLGAMLMKLGIGTSGYIQAMAGESVELPFAEARSRFAKIFCTDSAVEIVIDAIQVHGGYGYMHDYGVEKIFRDVKVLHLLGGSSPRLHMQTIVETM
ncbi:MAG: acyl-CoA/acyl-ACP dehydrogenase [Deltaproteobacteria bacterium]|nr:acyl-CoA/acyl-ACP dehydrogenase [Deltaproteobacteria bacterium]